MSCTIFNLESEINELHNPQRKVINENCVFQLFGE